MTRDPAERYSRQIMLPGLGLAGMERLSRATVLMVGMGAMAGTTLLYLAGAGVGRMLLLDPAPDASFRAGHRLLHALCRPGLAASAVAAETLLALNPTLAVHPLDLAATTLATHIPRCDLVLDAGENPELVEQINLLCHHHRVPLLAGRVASSWVHVRCLNFARQVTPCLHCLAPPALPVLPAGNWREQEAWHELAAGLAGCMMAEESLLMLAGVDSPRPWRYLDHHLASGFQRSGLATGDEACPVCTRPTATLPAEEGPARRQTLADDEIDITHEICPMTFVRVKLKLESMPPGARLRILLKGAEPLENVPRTLRHDGYVITPPVAGNHGIFTLIAVKPTG